MPKRNLREGAQPPSASGPAASWRSDRRQFLSAVAGGIGLVALGGCGDKAFRIHISGSSTLKPATEVMARSLNGERTDIRLDVSSGGTSQGLRMLRNGTADIAMLARKPSEDEREGLLVSTAAYDEIAVVKHPDTPLPDSLSLEQCRTLFASAKKQDGVIVFQKSEGHGTRQAFAAALNIRPEQLRGDAEAGSNGQMVQSISRTRGAVGYVSRVDAQAAIDAGVALTIVSIGGVAPALETAANGRYPIVRALSYAHFPIRRGTPASVAGDALRRQLAVQLFMDFAMGPEGQKILADHGFEPGAKG